MWRKWTLLLIVCAALLALVSAVQGGGGDLVTVRNFPDFAVAGKPLSLTFKVWVPSLEPLVNLRPAVRATNGKGLAIKYAAKAGGATGEYTAALIFPEPGDWVITFDTEYPDAAAMPPLRVIASGTPPPRLLPLATRGLRLYTAKGCNGCHLHGDVKGRLYGPDLTGKRFAPEYLRRFLADPSITPVPEEVCSEDRSYCGSPYPMPSLDLKKDEIEALIAFINKK